jgi:hypothetical protein
MRSGKFFLPVIPSLCLQKRNHVRRFIESSDNDSANGIKVFIRLFGLNISSDDELTYAFVTALEMRKYRIAAYLFCRANGSPNRNIGVPLLFMKHDGDLQRCLHILFLYAFWARPLVINARFKLLEELLDHADTLERCPEPSRLWIASAYDMLLGIQNLIPKWKTIKKRFISCFISLSMNDFFRSILDEFLCAKRRQQEVEYLLKIDIPGISVIDVIGLTLELEHYLAGSMFFVNGFFLEEKLKIPEELLNVSISLLQYVILIPAIINRGDNLTLDFFKTFVARDKRCLFQRDSKGNDVFYYLEKLRLQMPADKYNEIYLFIKNAYDFHLHKAITFFGGSEKYDEGKNSIVSILPHELVQQIVSLGFKAGGGR